MKKHHTKNKGDLGILKAQVSLFEQGYISLIPQTEHETFDLVAYKDGHFKRIQVKYRSVKNGKLEISFRSSWADKHGTHSKTVNKNEVDLYCVYCPGTDKCYWFDPKQFQGNVNLRVELPKNNQKAKIIWADDYLKILSS
jgi:hypothetical protein